MKKNNLSVLLGIILFSLFSQSAVAKDTKKDCISMGGTANLFTMGSTHGIGALTGTIDGAAYGAPVGEAEDLGDNKIAYKGIHYFLDKDGSHIYTEDDATMQNNPETGLSTFQTTYKVVASSGRFAGMKGSWDSRGWIKGLGQAEHAIGVVRFEGKICR